MKFRGAVILSVVFHISLFALAIYFPRTQISNEPTYYVDLISFSGSGGGGRGSTPPPTLKKDAGEETANAQQNTLRMKDLTVKKEAQAALRYPKKTNNKKSKTPKKTKKKEPERQEMISVVRKPKRTPSTDKGTENQNKEKGKTGINLQRKGVSLGAGSGSGYGTGAGSGSGGGMGGSGSSSPYAYYYDQIIQEVSSSWYSSLVTPGLKGKFITTVYFKIFRNGEVKDIKIERKSGIRSLDMSAHRAIENAAPFPQLPADYPYQYLVVHFDFTWEK